MQPTEPTGPSAPGHDQAASPCMMCNHPCPATPCGIKAPCSNCGWPYPHGSCAD